MNHGEIVSFLTVGPRKDGALLRPAINAGAGIVGIEQDRLESDDTFMRHLVQVVQNGLDARASTCIDPKTQIVHDKTVWVVSCQRSPEPVFLKWKGMEATPGGDFFVRSGRATEKLPPDSAGQYIKTRFATRAGQ